MGSGCQRFNTRGEASNALGRLVFRAKPKYTQVEHVSMLEQKR